MYGKLCSVFLLFIASQDYCKANRMLAPISNFIIEKQRTSGIRYNHHNSLRFHLREVVNEAFTDAISPNITDEYSLGIAESDQKIVLLGERIFGENVSNFCGGLSNNKFFHTPVDLRDGILFKPSKQIPIPVVNFTIHLPSRWFRDYTSRTPVIYVCYESDSFLKMLAVNNFHEEWESSGKFRKTWISNPYNERCRIREIFVVLDDFWNNRYLLPRNLEARALLETKSFLPRKIFTKECDRKLGMQQSCCLWKFNFNEADGTSREFHRCFGSIPSEALKSTQIPESLADLLLRGKMTRRFLNPPTRVCREIAFRPMVVKSLEGKLMKMDRLDAVKCAAFY